MMCNRACALAWPITRKMQHDIRFHVSFDAIFRPSNRVLLGILILGRFRRYRENPIYNC